VKTGYQFPPLTLREFETQILGNILSLYCPKFSFHTFGVQVKIDLFYFLHDLFLYVFLKYLIMETQLTIFIEAFSVLQNVSRIIYYRYRTTLSTLYYR